MAIVDWTIGAAGDFATLALHRSSEAGSPDTQRLTLLDDVILSAEVRYNSGEFVGGVIITSNVSGEFTGIFNEAGKRTIKTDGIMTTTLFQHADDLTLLGVQAFGGHTGSRVSVQDFNAKFSLVRSGILDEFTELSIQVQTATIVIDESIIITKLGKPLELFNSDSNVTVTDSILKGDAGFGIVRVRDGTITIENTLIDGAGNQCIRDDGVGNVTLSSVATTDTAGTTGLINQLIDDWYEDEPNDDYRINSVGQDILKGEGVGDSDIVDFYYLSGDIPPEYNWWYGQQFNKVIANA